MSEDKAGKNGFEPLAWQEQVIHIQSKYKKVWKLVALLGWLLAVILAIALAGLAPLKEVKPVFVRVNDTTGVVDVYETLDNRKIDITEAMNKSFIYRYIKTRERYLYQTYASDYELVNLMSVGSAKKEYNKIALNEDDPNNSFNKYKDEKEVRIKIISVSFIKKGNKEGVASVRFVKEIKANGETLEKTTLIATVTYEYVKRTVKEKLRLRNPLDFVVSQYGTEKEAYQ